MKYLKKTLAILAVVFGLIISGLCFSAGSLLSESGKELTSLQSRGGTSVAEVYYQKIGQFGVAFSLLSYALGITSFILSLGLGWVILTLDERLIERFYHSE